MTEARRNGKRPSAQDMTKAERKQLKKKDRVPAKMAVRQSDSPTFYFSIELL
jgi:hypothetical protein